MAITDDKLKYFAGLIEKEIGIVYSAANYYQLEHRINDITSQLGMSSVDELYEKAVSGFLDRSTKELLLDLATNNETSFFRDAAVFSGIERFVIPELLKQRPISRLAIWSAACSSGQEPYALSIQLEEAAKTNSTFPDFSIFCSDYSDRILKKAKAGVYGKHEITRGLPPKILADYFRTTDDTNWTIRPELQRKLRFQRLNLLEMKSVTEVFDIILCRNVLIYQTVDNKKMVLENLRQRIQPKGFLILGGAESMVGLSDHFTMHQFEGATFYQRND